MENVPGTREVKSSMEDGNPEVQIRINRQRAMEFGLTPGQVSSEIKTAISGTVATNYRHGGSEINVRVTSAEQGDRGLEALKNLPIFTAQGQHIPLSDVATFELSTGPVQIIREDQVREASVTCDLLNRDLNSVTKDIQAQVAKLQLPNGYTVDYGGANEQMVDAFSSLLLALIMAIMLVYVVLVVQYESFKDPFVILVFPAWRDH